MSMVREWWAKFRVRARHARDHGTSAVEYTFGLGNLIKQQFQNVSTSISTCSPDPANCPAGQPVPTVTK
jgi:hypothetical protein